MCWKNWNSQNPDILLGKRQKIALFYGVSALFIFLNIFFLVKRETLLAAALPFALLVVLLAFYRLNWLLLLITFCTPLSLPLSELFPNLPLTFNIITFIFANYSVDNFNFNSAKEI